MRKIRQLLEGKKTNIVGAVAWLPAILSMLGVDLDMTVGELVALALGGTGAMTLRAALARVLQRLF